MQATEADIPCGNSCLKGDDRAVLTVGNKVYAIADEDAVKAHSGHKVTVSGMVR